MATLVTAQVTSYDATSTVSGTLANGSGFHFLQPITLEGPSGPQTITQLALGIRWPVVPTLAAQDVYVTFYTGVNFDPTAADALSGATSIGQFMFTLNAPSTAGSYVYTRTLPAPITVPSNTFSIRFDFAEQIIRDHYSSDIFPFFRVGGAPTVGSNPGFVYVDTNNNFVLSGSEQTRLGSASANYYLKVVTIPEPATWMLLTLSLGILFAYAWRCGCRSHTGYGFAGSGATGPTRNLHGWAKHSFLAIGLAFPLISMAAPPANDNFAARQTLVEGVTAIVSTVEATIEPGEPVKDAQHTVWYTWTAASDAIANLDNIGTNYSDDYFAVYMGDALNKLVFVAGRFFSLGNGQERISFPVKAGTTFQIVAGGTRSYTGMVHLTLTTNSFSHAGALFGPSAPVTNKPFNDNFENASPVNGSALTAIAYNSDATLQGGEPERPFPKVAKTVWFKWTAPANATVSLDTTGTSIDGHFFAVYVGDTIQTLGTVAGNRSSGTSAVTDSFPAIGGMTYRIAVGSIDTHQGTFVLTLTTSPPPSGALLNLSTRGLISTGDNVIIAGFIVSNGTKRLIIRGLGPSLAKAHVANALLDPSLELRDGTGNLLAANNNWQESAQSAPIQAAGLAPTDPRESAVLATLNPGAYTAITRGVNNSSGVGLVEVYDIDGSAAVAKAVNVSTRGFVSTGDSVMIAGFIVGGDSPAHVIVRGIGPSLAAFGIANPLQNPKLDLYNSNGSKLVSNDNWQEADNFGQVMDAHLAPSDARESAISATLTPAAYTAILSGINNTTGVGLVEVYRGP